MPANARFDVTTMDNAVMGTIVEEYRRRSDSDEFRDDASVRAP